MLFVVSPSSGVSRWQSTYVRYKGQSEGQVCQDGWDKESSQSIQEQLVMPHNPNYPPRVHTNRNNALVPNGINMKILTAPAEFAVPVKQDR